MSANKPSNPEKQRQAHALRMRGLTFEQIRLLYKWTDEEGVEHPVFKTRTGAKQAFDRETLRLMNETVDYRRLSLERVDALIADNWANRQKPQTLNALTRLIVAQSMLAGAIRPNGVVDLTQDQSVSSLPGKGTVSAQYANWGGSEDLDDAAEIIDAEFTDSE